MGRGGPTQGTYEDSDDPGFEDCEGRWEDGEDGHCSLTGIVVVVVSPIGPGGCWGGDVAIGLIALR